MIELLDPTGNFGSKELVLAERPHSLKGLRIALIDNTKVNAQQLLRKIGNILVRDYGATQACVYRKKHASTPVHDPLIEELVQDADIIISGIGDCGSCSSATVLDGIMMEKAGRPAVSIVTHFFVNTGRAMAKQWGVPEYKFISVQHPVANLTEEELNVRAQAAVDSILERVLQTRTESSNNNH
ncbi:UGSC family (seleno)protein [Sinorhizobium meliloti]|uniref:UGSC family (seleno)protein n=1 Tax=Rhizobium meliloti TaxID=382 RepID=UPI003F145DA8